jgi:hypothetical protein
MQQDIKQDFIDHLKQELGLSDSEAEDFLEWMNENNWQSFDGMGRWIRTVTRTVMETKQLYKTYVTQTNGTYKS